MSRPRKDSETQIEDLFFDADIDTQARLLRMLERLHKLKRRQITELTDKYLTLEKKADA